MKLLTIYESILRFAGLESDDKGLISTSMENTKQPTVIDGLRLVLPTNEQLRNFNPKETIVFHPLTENILRGESEVIQKLKFIINIRLNYVIGIVAQSLLGLISSPELHSRLTPEQSEILLVVKEADEKSVANLVNVMLNGVKNKPDRLFTNIYLKRGGVYQGKKFSRVGVVNFPFYQELLQPKVEKEKLRAKDKETFKQLFEYMFEGIGQEEYYNYGSNSQVAPFLDALLKSSANIASRLNDIIAIYEPFIDNSEMLTFDSDWMDYFDNLDELLPEIRKVPVQHGNDGSVSVTEEQSVQQLQPVAVVPQYQPQQTYQPQYQPVPQQPLAPQRPELKQTKRGLDFKSVLQTNPALAYNPNPLTPVLQQQRMIEQQQMMANRQPSWAPQPTQGYQQPYMGQQPMMQMQQPVYQQAPSWAGGQPMMQMQQPMQGYQGQQGYYGV